MNAQRVRWWLGVRGRVQGVGFRPFVVRLATELALGGIVGNDSDGAFIELEGPLAVLERFEARLRAELPPLARISEIERREARPTGEAAFAIVASRRGPQQAAEVTPDAGICADCRRELVDPHDRRYRYPFINCTNCGPRYSIIRAVPYDRPATTMQAFAMCPQCQAEYDSPADRRYHAQPNACPACGPQVWLVRAGEQGAASEQDTAAESAPLHGDQAIVAAAAALRGGAIVAIKGLGGFHLACRGDDQRVVERLRARKGREAKPLALMVASIVHARQLAQLDPASEQTLSSSAAPIVVCARQAGGAIAPAVAPESELIGLMLPYTPLHLVLFASLGAAGPPPALVMTSGNPSEEPLSAQNEEALERLATIADYLLLHDRGIERPIDDSVWLAHEHGPLMLRRARGYVPDPLLLRQKSAHTVLAFGGDLKASVCLLAERRAVLSEHLGDLENPAAYRNYLAAIERLRALTRVDPELIACDLHPGYLSAQAAHHYRDLPVVAVQHHHAHAVACMAENGLEETVVAIVCDGTGYGDDGAIWGGELLLCDRGAYQRAGHLDYFPLFGGDLAAKQGWRPAAGLCQLALGDAAVATLQTLGADAEALELAQRRLASAPQSSSLGRLFDATAFLLGFCAHNRFEGEAAIRLEAAATRVSGRDFPPPSPHGEALAHGSTTPLELPLIEREGKVLLDHRPLIRGVVQGLDAGDDPAHLAWAFHEAIARGLAQAAVRIAVAAGVHDVVLSGGCMLNRLLDARLGTLLTAAGLDVHRHRELPPGDGGLALGQAVVAASRAA